MPALTDEVFEPKTLTPEQALAAKDSSRKLVPLAKMPKVRLQLKMKGVPEEVIELPAPAVKILARLLAHMAKGEAVTLVPTEKALTTNEAADFLNVSRPYLIKLLDSKKIPCQMVGKHRRVLFRDLSDYKRKMRQERLKALDQMAELSQELG